MKKLLAIVLVMAILCSLTACGEFVLFRETKPLQVKRVFPRGTIEGRNYENQLIGIGFKRRDDGSFCGGGKPPPYGKRDGASRHMIVNLEDGNEIIF